MGNIQMIGKTLGGMYRAEKPLLTALVPDRALDEIARHAVDFWLTTEDLPDPGQSRDGRPRRPPHARLHAEQSGSDAEALREAALHARRDRPAAAASRRRAISICATTFRSPAARIRPGTCRFGDDPATSVLDRNCKAHELDNLYVVDTSFFVSIGAVNPSLTAIANALRVGDHIRKRIGA